MESDTDKKNTNKKMDMQGFLSDHKLPDNYEDIAQQWFHPLCQRVLKHQSSKHNDNTAKPFIIGVSGCQGSGKTTLSSYIATYLTSVHHKTVVSLSIDDFYLNQTDRLTLAKNIHPLLKTRGVPSTHDMPLALKTFKQLQNGTFTRLPRFDKATDNPYPVEQWSVIDYVPDFIVLEGWCVGVIPQCEEALIHPVNNLEEKQDSHAIWRTYVNRQLAGEYQTLFDMIDYSVFLKAPTFDCVFDWRLEQEQKLLAGSNQHGKAIMTEKQIATFVQHYQRLTQHALKTLPNQSDTVFFLNETRMITKQKVSE